METNTLEKIVSLCKRRGFIYSSSEIYGGFASTYDLGPLGTLLAEEIKKVWRTSLVQQRKDVTLMDGAIFAHPKTWEASGHVENFNDPLVEDKVTHIRYRADHLLEDKLGIDTSTLTGEQMNDLIVKNNIKSPDGNELTGVKQFNLMMEATIGCTEKGKDTAFLRGETCQVIFLQYKNLLNYMRNKLPFGVLQMGKAFRNEVTTKQFIIRTREFSQLEFEYFVKEEESFEYYEFWKEFFKNLLVNELGLGEGNIRYRKIPKEEMSHYAKEQYDIEYKLSNGKWLEISPLNHRGEWDLSRHQKYSGEDMQFFDQETKKRYIPNVLETSFGLERLIYCLLDKAYTEEEFKNHKGETESRTVLKLAYSVAPVKAIIMPLMKKEDLVNKADELYNILNKEHFVDYDDSGSIGKRYRRADEIGTPFCITIDYQTLEDKTVTIRFRDTMKQIRVSYLNLSFWLKSALEDKTDLV